MAIVLPASALVSATPALAYSCINEKTDTVTFKSVGSINQQTTYMSTSGKITVSGWGSVRPDTKASKTVITMRSCKSGKTRVLRDYKVYQVHDDLTMTTVGEKTDFSPASGEVGFGVMVSKVTSSAVELKAVRCTKDFATITGWDALRGLTMVPWPVPGWAAVGITLGSLAIPSTPKTFTCASVGSVAKFGISLSTSGKVSAKTKKVQRSAGMSWQDVCPRYRYCTVAERNTVTITSS